MTFRMMLYCWMVASKFEVGLMSDNLFFDATPFVWGFSQLDYFWSLFE